jgi:hypothetical protein
LAATLEEILKTRFAIWAVEDIVLGEQFLALGEPLVPRNDWRL